ncbi:hypothetical protein CA830_35590, partial [Burkholderia multivorans]
PGLQLRTGDMKLISNILLFIALYIAARMLDAMQYHFWGVVGLLLSWLLGLESCPSCCALGSAAIDR